MIQSYNTAHVADGCAIIVPHDHTTIDSVAVGFDTDASPHAIFDRLTVVLAIAAAALVIWAAYIKASEDDRRASAGKTRGK